MRTEFQLIPKTNDYKHDIAEYECNLRKIEKNDMRREDHLSRAMEKHERGMEIASIPWLIHRTVASHLVTERPALNNRGLRVLPYAERCVKLQSKHRYKLAIKQGSSLPSCFLKLPRLDCSREREISFHSISGDSGHSRSFNIKHHRLSIVGHDTCRGQESRPYYSKRLGRIFMEGKAIVLPKLLFFQ